MAKKTPDPQGPSVLPGLNLSFGYQANTEPIPEKKSWWERFAGKQEINRRPALIMLGVLILLPASYYPLRLVQDKALRRSARDQARQLFDAGQTDKAIVTAQNYVYSWPENYEGLELMGELAVKSPTTSEQLLFSIEALDLLLRLDPDAPSRQEDRKRLVQLLMRLGDTIRAVADNRKSGLDQFEGRYQYANNIAEQRIKLGADDADAHRLLAMTLERLSIAGEAESEAKAIKEYQKALRKDPGDSYSAERLASLRMERKDGQAKPELAGADQILDNLVKARPRSVDARLARIRHYLKTGREDRAKLDLEAASKLDANNLGIKLTAATLALRRGDAASAKRYLASISDPNLNGEYDVLLAQIELTERRPEQAIEKLRKGLARSGGTDLTLTYRLAHTLILNGRTSEARPLIQQFQRLSGHQESPMIRLLEGIIRERSGRYTSAIVDLEAGRDDIPRDWKGELEMTLGHCYEMTGDIDDARKAYENARKVWQSSPGPHQALARLLLKVTPDKAIEELTEAVRLSQGQASPGLLADLANAQAIRQLSSPPDRRNWSAAEASIEQGLRIRPDDTALHLTRVKLLNLAGHPELADAKLTEACQGVARRSEELWLARARQLEVRGKREDALRVLEQASSPNGAGDHATFRASRAKLLVQLGRGRAALELLTPGAITKLSVPDRALLARTRAEVLLALGDHAGAVASALEWNKITPEDPTSSLLLIEMARRGGTTEDLEQALELLRKAGGNDEPTLIAAQAIALLLPRADQDEVDATKLDQAESLSLSLQESAPKLPATALVRAILFEQGSEVEEAINQYKDALKGDISGLALPRLIAMLTRLKRTDELVALKSEVKNPARVDQIAIKETLDAGDKDQAEAILTKLVAAQPDNLEYHADLARVLRDLGKPEQAEATIRSLVDRLPERPQPWLALLALQSERGDKTAVDATIERLKTAYHGDRPNLLLARCLWAIGHRDEATKVASSELARQPNDLEVIRLASEIEEANGRFDRAEHLIERARAIEPKLAWARRRMALILSSRSNATRWPEAKALATPSGTTESVDDRWIRALVLDRGPDPASRAEALGVFRSLADDLPITHPIGYKARLTLAELLVAAKNLSEAAEVLGPVIAESGSPSPRALTIAIQAFALDGKPEEARRLLDLLTKAQPDSQMTTVCRALVLKAEGDQQAATSEIVNAAAGAEQSAEGERLNRYYYDQLTQIGSDDAIEQMARRLAQKWPAQGIALARFLASKGRIEEALTICQSAIEAGPSREPISLIVQLDSMGKLEASQIDKARELTVSAALRAPKDIELFSMATLLLRRHQRFEDEASFYRKLLAIDPTNYAARNNLAWVLAKDLGKPADGLAEIDRVIKLVGPVHQALDTRGMILIKLGRVNDAIADFEKSTKMAPTAVHQIHLARAYAQAGRTDDRLRTLQSAKLAVTNPKLLEPEDRAELESLNP